MVHGWWWFGGGCVTLSLPPPPHACYSYIGVGFAVATFAALLVMVWVKHDGKDVTNHIVEAFIIAVTIIVVAIPEVRRTSISS